MKAEHNVYIHTADLHFPHALSFIIPFSPFLPTVIEYLSFLPFPLQISSLVAVVVEWLACLPVTQKIGVRFYVERESSATSGWINVGREWCCRGWGIEGGTPGGLFRTRDGLPRIRKARAARNVHECESVSAWNKKKKTKHCICAEMAALYECLYVCCISLYMYMYVFKIMCVFHCTALRAFMM